MATDMAVCVCTYLNGTKHSICDIENEFAMLLNAFAVFKFDYLHNFLFSRSFPNVSEETLLQ